MPLFYFVSHLPDSNRGPLLYESIALPAELRWLGAGEENRTPVCCLGSNHTTTVLRPHSYSSHTLKVLGRRHVLEGISRSRFSWDESL